MLASRELRYQHAGHGAALAYADVALPQRGVLLLHGPTGSGQSTWLALAAGLLAPSAGQITVAGVQPASLSAAERSAWRVRTIGLLPHAAPLNPALTVRANLALAFFAMGVKEDRWAINHVMTALQIEAWAKAPASSLPPVRARRVALARALLLEPPLLLLDEPVAGLAPDEAQALLQALHTWVADKGSTLVMAARDAAPLHAVFSGAQTLRLPAVTPVAAPAAPIGASA